MSEQKRESMESVCIESKYFVNEPTLELLTRRIETEVKTDVMRWVGFPAGGAGIIAIIIALFFVLPSEVEKFISKDPLIQKTLKDTVKSYIEKPEVENIITKKTKEYVSNEVNEYFKSDQAKELIFKAVNESLKPVVKKMSKKISENSQKLIINVQIFEEITSFEKGSPDYLAKILKQKEVEYLRDSKIPIALTMPIGKGKKYNPYIIRTYIDELQQYFGDNFKYVTVIDDNGKLLANLMPNQVKEKHIEIYNILNNSSDKKKVKNDLMNLFGTDSVVSIYQNLNVKDALEKNLWSQYDKTNIEVAVVNDKDEFIGTTSREKLINGILN